MYCHDGYTTCEHTKNYSRTEEDQLVERLPRVCEVLGSIPSNRKNNSTVHFQEVN